MKERFKQLTSSTRAEWAHLRANPILAISLSVVLLIPIMYAGFFLGSIWNPYGNTQHLPVAIVNEDQGSTANGAPIHVGDDVVEKLKHNTAMGWHFVSKADADKGIQDGTYYMSLELPASLSKDISSASSQKPTKATITYTLTPSRNYVGSLLTEQAAKQVNQTITDSVKKSYLEALLDALYAAGTGFADASSGAQQLATGGQQLQNGIDAYTGAVGQLYNGQSALTNGLSQAYSGTQALQNGANQLGNGLPTPTQIQQLSTSVSQVQTGLSQLNSAVETPSKTILADQAAVSSDAATLKQQLTAYQAAANADAASLTRLQQALGAGAAANAPTVTVQTVDLGTAMTLLSQSQQIATTSGTLLTHLNTLTNDLSTQQVQLVTSVATLSNGMNELAPNLQRALGGYTAVGDGVLRLQNGASQLVNGSQAAYTGSQRIQGGLGQLAGQSSRLQQGSSQLTDGSETLAGALGSAATRLQSQPTGESTLNYMASPLNLKEVKRGQVPNYGYALAPYVISLGLFVGALVFNVIYPVRRFFATPNNARDWWLSKASVAGLVSLGQALIVDAIMVWGLGLHPVHPVEFVALTIVTSLTFMAIVSLLVIALDNIGRFLAMLLLVLQLGSSEGVFPIMLSGTFYQFLNPIMPMTYSIRAFREAISGELGAATYAQNLIVLLGVIAVASALLILFLRRHGMHRFRHESIEAD